MALGKININVIIEKSLENMIMDREKLKEMADFIYQYLENK